MNKLKPHKTIKGKSLEEIGIGIHKFIQTTVSDLIVITYPDTLSEVEFQKLTEVVEHSMPEGMCALIMSKGVDISKMSIVELKKQRDLIDDAISFMEKKKYRRNNEKACIDSRDNGYTANSKGR